MNTLIQRLKKILNNQVFWFSLSIALVVLILVITIPKNLYQDKGSTVQVCDCIGSTFSYDTKCIGFRSSCQQIPKESNQGECKQTTCDELFSLLGISTTAENSTKSNAVLGASVLLVIDVSNSMIGERLQAAKNAAIGVVDNKRENEKIGIVAFSNNISSVHEFTEDKDKLVASIQNLTVSGGTKYLPALSAAQNLFSSRPASENKGIIFLSDGVPSDDIPRIKQKSQELLEANIPIFSISFGIDDAAMEENILAEMAGNPTSRWYRSFKDKEQIALAFSEAYQEITDIEVLDINPEFISHQFLPNEVGLIGTRISLKDKLITGEYFEESAICSPQIEVALIGVAQDNKTVSTKLEAKEDSFFVKDQSWDPAEYEVTAYASLKLDDSVSCHFSGEEYLGTINISNSSNICTATDCSELSLLLDDFDFAAASGSAFSIDEKDRRIAIMIDSSQSMTRYKTDLFRAVRRVNSLLSTNDQRALITFSDESKLVQPLTSDAQKFFDSLELVRAQGTTRIIPALKKSRLLFSTKNTTEDIVIIFSDGKTHDTGGNSEILMEAEKLIEQGVCVYVIGYGTTLISEKEQAELYKDIVSLSQHKHQCGYYYYTPQSEALAELVSNIFEIQLGGDDDLRVLTQIPEVVHYGESVKITTTIISARTGLILPARYRSRCVKSPTVTVVVNQGNEEIQSHSFDQDTFEKTLFVSDLLPGKYTAQISATLDGNSCQYVGTEEVDFIVKGKPKERYEEILIIGILEVLALIYLSLLKYWRIKT